MKCKTVVKLSKLTFFSDCSLLNPPFIAYKTGAILFRQILNYKTFCKRLKI